MSVPEACLRTRVLATTHRTPFLLSTVAARRITIPSIPSKVDRREGARAVPRALYGARAKWERQGRSVALFQNVVAGAAEKQQQQQQQQETSAADAAAEVRLLLQSGQLRPEHAWEALKGEILPAGAAAPDGQGGGGVEPAAWALLDGLIKLKTRDVAAAGDVPSATELAQVYVDVARAKNPRPLLRLMTALLEHVARGACEGEGEREKMLADIVGLWVVICCGREGYRSDGIRPPSLERPEIRQLARRKEAFSAMLRAATVPAPRSQQAGLGAAVLATYLLVEESGLRSSEMAKPLAPLLSFAEEVMGAVWAGPRDAMCEFDAGQSETLRSYVEPRLHVFRPRKTTTTSTSQDPGQIHRTLSRAFKSRDLELIRRTWASLALQIEASGDAVLADRESPLRRRYADLVNFCVFIWCALGQDDIDVVLRFMGAHGFEYTLKTYTSMMEGWKQARKPRNIGLLWARLVEDRVPLDSVIWSARISALMACGLEKPAVRALFEMGQLWDDAVAKEAARGAAAGSGSQAAEAGTGPPPPVKPDIGPVNAALTGVLRSKGIGAAPAILSWAARYGIDPDVVTYNMLLRAMLRAGLAAEADALLLEMKARGVAADAATFTIIVEEVLGAAAGGGEEKEVEAVRGIFAAIKASGQKAKVATYAKMIHVLLDRPESSSSSAPLDSAAQDNNSSSSSSSNNGGGGGPTLGSGSAAVREVLSHMRRSGAQPSSHIFTIIADHHLSRLEVPAVREMIAAWDLAAPGSDRVDGVFWEVVIRGFARVGLVGEAKAMFFGLRKETRVALSVLDQLLVGLLGEGDVEGARDLVAAVRERMADGDAVEGGRGWAGDDGEERERYMRHHFWHVVAENGLDVEEPSR